MASLIGRKLGQYEVVEQIDRGGMATVYKGFQPSVGRYVAIKVLPPHPGLDEQFIERFKLEAKTIGSLQNPHILPLYDYGMSEDNVLYLVMALADGGSLSSLIDHGPVDLLRVERLLRAIASGLDYAHRRGIVHRDIKPGNILLDGEGNPLIADFGIVKMLSSGANLTGTAVVGTPAYMSPEQAQGMEIDGRADIYALAVMVYEMLAGKQPYQGDTPMQVLLKHINAPVPDLLTQRSELPAELGPVMERALAKEPDQRYQTAIQFAEAFSEAIHRRDASRAAIRAAQPLQVATSIPASTIPAGQAASAENPTNPTSPSQTIIMRDSVNPLVLLAGFGLIALVIVIVAVLLINQPGGRDPVVANPTGAETQASAEVSPTARAVAAQPTSAVRSFGETRFSSVNSLGDTVLLRLSGVRRLSGERYAAWLTHSENDEFVALGEVITDATGEGSVVFTDSQGRMLPSHFNGVIITRETSIGDAPSGPVAYRGEIPAAISSSLLSIFVADERGIRGGSLIDGAIQEARAAEQHSGLAARATNVGGMRTHAEHTINILRGTADDLDGDGVGTNPGRGIGVYFFLDAISAAVEEATNDPGATVSSQANGENIRVCIQNVRNWADEVIELENVLLQAESVAAAAEAATRSTTLAGQMLAGFDLNDNGQIEPFEGECGLEQISDYGILFGNIALVEGEAN